MTVIFSFIYIDYNFTKSTVYKFFLIYSVQQNNTAKKQNKFFVDCLQNNTFCYIIKRNAIYF